MRARPWWTALVILAGMTVEAHIPLHGVGTECRVVFKEDRVLLVFDLSYDGFWSQQEMIGADLDKSSSVETAEAEAYLRKRWEEKVRPGIRMKIDGQEAAVRKVAERHEGLVGEIFAVRFSLYYELEVEIPASRRTPGATHLFEMEDTVVQKETPAKPRFVVPYKGHGEGESARFRPRFLEPELQILDLDGYVLESARIRVEFGFGEPDRAANPAGVMPRVVAGDPGTGSGTGTGTLAGKGPGTETGESRGSGQLEDAVLRYDQLRWYEVLAFVLVAILYGAGHALTPGHGKSLVAAYLIGTRGRVRDAVILGLATTITHTGSVFLFGIGIFLIVNAGTRFSPGQTSNLVIVACQLLSGLLLVVLGITLFFRRRRGGRHDPSPPHPSTGKEEHHHHHHHHHHAPPHDPGPTQTDARHQDHDHHHHHRLATGPSPRFRDLLLLGFSGGLVPCPAGLTIILIGLQYPHRLLFALALLVAFSIGLGSVLIALGVFLVTGHELAAENIRDGMFFQRLPFLGERLPRSFLAALDRRSSKLYRLLPALSSLFIAGLGAFFCVSAFRHGRSEIATLLERAADWLR